MLTLTIDNVNALLELHFADPTGIKSLQESWKKFFLDNFELDDGQRRDLIALPDDRAEFVRKAIDKAITSRGKIKFTAESGTKWRLEYHSTSPRTTKPSSPRPEWFPCKFGKHLEVDCEIE
jgi:hypothetical protein